MHLQPHLALAAPAVEALANDDLAASAFPLPRTFVRVLGVAAVLACVQVVERRIRPERQLARRVTHIAPTTRRRLRRNREYDRGCRRRRRRLHSTLRALDMR